MERPIRVQPGNTSPSWIIRNAFFLLFLLFNLNSIWRTCKQRRLKKGNKNKKPTAFLQAWVLRCRQVYLLASSPRTHSAERRLSTHINPGEPQRSCNSLTMLIACSPRRQKGALQAIKRRRGVDGRTEQNKHTQLRPKSATFFLFFCRRRRFCFFTKGAGGGPKKTRAALPSEPGSRCRKQTARSRLPNGAPRIRAHPPENTPSAFRVICPRV